uniref:hypothetical protein n=1 Tax=Enterococcus casseliflavus TaxID=37734 RepID=UPI0011A847CF
IEELPGKNKSRLPMTNKIPKTKQAITNLVDLDTSLFETLMINKVMPTANVKKYQNPIIIANFL